MPDPGNPQALNRYGYALNNPVKYADPTGHWPRLPSLGGLWGGFTDFLGGVVSAGGSFLRASADAAWSAIYGAARASAVGMAEASMVQAEAQTALGIAGAEAAGTAARWALDQAPGLASRYSGATWNLVNSKLGLDLGAMSVAFGGSARQEEGGNVMVFENVQGPARWLVQDLLARGSNDPNAVTLGHVILNSGRFDMGTDEGRWWYTHERSHVVQGDLMGVSYLPLYGAGYLTAGLKHDAHFMEFWANAEADRLVYGLRP